MISLSQTRLIDWALIKSLVFVSEKAALGRLFHLFNSSLDR